MRMTLLTLIAGAGAIATGAAYAQTRPAAPPDLDRSAVEARAAQAFQRIDANGDGRISPADREARQRQLFGRLDADGDGAIRFDEFAALRDQRASRPARAARPGLRGPAMRPGALGPSADSDGDGALTQAEFAAALLARFDAADANGDGTVTAAERRARRDALREQRRERRAARTG